MKTDQTTIREPAEVSGKGLHTGGTVTIRLLPAAADSGVNFKRVDLPGSPMIPARVDALDGRQARHTVLANGAASVQTVEHV
ncbi:MAG: UDP-3-O-acyl-N-acetylglucosamine deacetylase, partial [Planctomycetota bacterium]